MQEEVIKRRIKKILFDEFNLYTVFPDGIDDDGMLYSGGAGIDSIQMVSLACTIEDEFGIKIPDDRLRNFKTINDAARCIKELMEK